MPTAHSHHHSYIFSALSKPMLLRNDNLIYSVSSLPQENKLIEGTLIITQLFQDIKED